MTVAGGGRCVSVAAVVAVVVAGSVVAVVSRSGRVGRGLGRRGGAVEHVAVTAAGVGPSVCPG